MALKKHIPFINKQAIVFLFLFLNCLFTAAPFVHASSANNKYTDFSTNFNYSLYSAETKDCTQLPNYPEGQPYCHLAIKNRHASNKCFSYNVYSPSGLQTISCGGSTSDYALRYSTFALRPAYYTFLFLYQLF